MSIATYRFPPSRLAGTGYSGLCLLVIGCSAVPAPSAQPFLPETAPTVELPSIGILPHDPAASTQGLYYHDGHLIESTGGYGSSTLRRIPVDTTGLEVRLEISDRYFAEGIAQLDGRIYQLTWRERTALVYDAETLQQIDTFGYSGEGWGLTTDGTSLVMSDGTDRLRFLDPHTFAVLSSLRVRDGPHPVRNLNELEWIEGEIWANVWFRNKIAVIDPATGIVRRWIDLTPFLPAGGQVSSAAVPNGIAYDASTGRVFITGKLWPHIEVVEAPGARLPPAYPSGD